MEVMAFTIVTDCSLQISAATFFIPFSVKIHS